MMKVITVTGLCFLTVVLQSEAILDVRRHSTLYGEEPWSPVVFNQTNVTEEFITQRLDNFDTQNNGTFQMRYFKNEQYAKEGRPILISLGGEWTITKGYLLKSHLHDIAVELNALLLYTEHRYYGLTRPTSDLENENIKYLSVEQALADVAHFITEIKSNPKYENSSVVVVGGSYAGTMATWMRQKYPHLVAGAWASSAPLQAQLDFKEYKEVVGQSIAIVGGSECPNLIRRGFALTEKLFDDGKTAKLKKYFQLCDDFDPTEKYNEWNFISKLANIYSYLVQRNWPGHIKRTCDILARNNTSNRVILRAFSHLFRYHAVGSSKSCLKVNYNDTVDFYRRTNYSKNENRQWFYQVCSEFGWHQTSSSASQPFGSRFPLDLNTKLCRDVFGEDFSNVTQAYLVDRKNTLYGGMNPAVKNVIFTHGQLDPWRSMGIQKDLNKQSPAILIPGVSHCKDLGPINLKHDSREMIYAKIAVRNAIKSWV